MSPERLGTSVLIAAAAVIFFYLATSATDGATIPVPATQNESQFFGIDVGGATEKSLCKPEVHFWAPGWSSGNTGEPVKTCPHRYPLVTGGNISTVIHHGWKGFSSRTPANDDWRLNPPEVAVL